MPMPEWRALAPADFPFDAWESLSLAHAPLNPQSPEREWMLFTGGLNAALFRFLACAEHDDAFTESIQRAGGGPGTRDRYAQEKDLFGFFVSALSAIECTCFAVNAIGARVAPTAFPLAKAADEKAVNPWEVSRRFVAAFPTDPLSQALGAALADQQFQDLSRIRNVLGHRLAPGRTINATIGSAPPVESPTTTTLRGFVLSDSTTAKPRVWLAKTLANLFAQAEAFTVNHATKP